MLVQTDTTVGFASQNAAALAACKGRPADKPFLKTFATLGEYRKQGRVPAAFKRELRRSGRTTYVVKNQAFRIVAEGAYHAVLKRCGWCYSTSANAASERFDPAFAFQAAEIIVEDGRGFFETEPSAIFRLNQHRKSRLR